MPVKAYSGIKNINVAEIVVYFCEDDSEYQKMLSAVEKRLQFVLEDVRHRIYNYGTVYEFVKMVKSNLETENAEFSVFVKFN